MSCREKLKTLEENDAELRQVMQDAFEDAVLMGVDEAAMRGRILTEIAVEGLAKPEAVDEAVAGDVARLGCCGPCR